MRSRILLAPVFLLAIAADTLVGCDCVEVLDKTPAPIATLVAADQLAPPLANLDLTAPLSAVGTTTVLRFTIENRGNATLNVADIAIASDAPLCPSPSAAFAVTAPAQSAGSLRSAGIATDYSYLPAKVGKQAQLAEQLGARAALTIGSEFPEVRLKDLAARSEEVIDASAATVAVSALLSTPGIPPLLE